jgi:uncharacterized protein (DUF58 family)
VTDAQAGSGETDTRETDARWRRNPAMVFGGLTSAGLAGAGLLFSRPELVLFAAPVILSLIWVWQRRTVASARVRIDTTIGAASASDTVDYAMSFAVPDEVEAVAARLHSRARERYDVVVDRETAAMLGGQIEIVHSGPQEIVRVDYVLVGPLGGSVTLPEPGPRSRRVISPRTVALRRLPLPFRMLGLAGGHDSARPGDGGEFRDVSQFTPGDRLRRIDWKVTARRAQAPGDLYVRRSFATADATALIVVDSRDEVSELVTRRGSTALPPDETTSLDLAREAASSLASAYIKAGDRVGFQDLSGNKRIIAPGGGLRHLHRLLPAIARAEPVGAPSRRVRPPVIPAGAIVYVISTFLDYEVARMAELWRASGHRVLAVDVLPNTPTDRLGREERAALRIITMERQDRIDALRAVGIDVIEWSPTDGPSPESQLSVYSRLSRRPR